MQLKLSILSRTKPLTILFFYLNIAINYAILCAIRLCKVDIICCHMFDRWLQKGLLQIDKLCGGKYGKYGQPWLARSDIWERLFVFFTLSLNVLLQKYSKLKFSKKMKLREYLFSTFFLFSKTFRQKLSTQVLRCLWLNTYKTSELQKYGGWMVNK